MVCRYNKHHILAIKTEQATEQYYGILLSDAYCNLHVHVHTFAKQWFDRISGLMTVPIGVYEHKLCAFCEHVITHMRVWSFPSRYPCHLFFI